MDNDHWTMQEKIWKISKWVNMPNKDTFFVTLYTISSKLTKLKTCSAYMNSNTFWTSTRVFTDMYRPVLITALFYEGFTKGYTVTGNKIQFIYIVAFHSLTYTMYTIYKLFHFHTHTHPHTQSHTRQMLRILKINNTIIFEKINRFNYKLQVCVFFEN